MKLLTAFLAMFVTLGSALPAHAAKKKIMVVSSYAADYGWSQETSKGLAAAMLKIGWFDTKEQIEEFAKNDKAETSKVILSKYWMDAKKKTKPEEKLAAAERIMAAAADFKPDLVFLGDDDAAEYIGRRYLDTPTPVVFWGVNNTPVKYGLLDSAEKPGHNVTGVYQSGYYKESLELVKKLVPKAQTFAVLTENSTTGKAYASNVGRMHTQGLLKLKLVDSIVVADFEEFKAKALDLAKRADVIFYGQYTSLKDAAGAPVKDATVTKWIVEHIKVPDAVGLDTFVKQGLLCAAVDSGYKQAWEAVMMAQNILDKNIKPADIAALAPTRGPLTVNLQRAAQLGIKITKDMGVEESIKDSTALK